mmetsp:Transcript_9551/g.14994  ORF Transcript_9551/g.14994 Transcript_9551/m.14994 type:complete len:173 (-) Transcript_9551:39-557(-)
MEIEKALVPLPEEAGSKGPEGFKRRPGNYPSPSAVAKFRGDSRRYERLMRRERSKDEAAALSPSRDSSLMAERQQLRYFQDAEDLAVERAAYARTVVRRALRNAAGKPPPVGDGKSGENAHFTGSTHTWKRRLRREISAMEATDLDQAMEELAAEAHSFFQEQENLLLPPGS